MERSDLLKLLVVFIAVIFVLSMFSQFGRSQSSGSQSGQENTTLGTGSGTCRIVAFSTELLVKPWNNDTAAVADELKAEKKVQYTNVFGSGGVVILPAGANISEVRAAFADLDSNVVADASCNVNGVVNFTLQNGTTIPQAPGSVRLSLDPYSQIGDELYLDITADISESGITNMRATPVSLIEESATNATADCGNDYQIGGTIAWDKRDINISAIASELNISEQAITYSKNDVVTFSRMLNNSEVEGIKAKNLSYIYNVLIPGLQANTTDEGLITAVTGGLSNVTPTFQPSPITIDLNGNSSMAAAADIITSNGGTVRSRLRGCTLTIDRIMGVNGMNMLVSSDTRRLDYLIDIADVPQDNQSMGIFGNASYVGRIVTSFDMIGTR